jgi:hypothetical protein
MIQAAMPFGIEGALVVAGYMSDNGAMTSLNISNNAIGTCVPLSFGAAKRKPLSFAATPSFSLLACLFRASPGT